MKKNLSLLFALLCAITFFTACSDDEKPNWEKLPQGEIKADDIDLKLDGENTTGTVTFKATSAETGQFNFKNVVDGYSDITVDVKLTENADGSFDFTGTKEYTTLPVTRAAATSAILTVKVDGTITSNGKATANIILSGLGVYIGTYSKETLNLTYSESALVGKTVIFDGTEVSNINIKLLDVIPGESTTVLTGIQQTTDGGFSGSANTANATVEYEGSLKNKVLTLALKVKLNDAALGGISGTWPLLDKIDTDEYMSEIKSAPFHLEWPAIKVQVGVAGTDGEQIARLASVIASHIVAEVLSQVTFNVDGNITAKYGSKLPFNGDTAMEWITTNAFYTDINVTNEEWTNSPQNLAFWYAKDNLLYVKPDINMIIKQVSESTGKDLSSVTAIVSLILNQISDLDDAKLADLLAMASDIDFIKKLGIDLTKIPLTTIRSIISWVSTGIPLIYENNGDGLLRVYVDKTMVDPIMNILIPLLPTLQAEFDKIAAQPGNELMGMLPLLLALNKFTDIKYIWEENTKAFELGLEFAK